MLLHDTRPQALPDTLPISIRHAANVRLPVCPQCSDLVLAPLMAEHIDARHVRNHWVCESCGHAFLRSVRVAVSSEDTFAI